MLYIYNCWQPKQKRKQHVQANHTVLVHNGMNTHPTFEKLSSLLFHLGFTKPIFVSPWTVCICGLFFLCFSNGLIILPVPLFFGAMAYGSVDEYSALGLWQTAIGFGSAPVLILIFRRRNLSMRRRKLLWVGPPKR